MIAEFQFPAIRHVSRTARAAAGERSYLCTFLNEQCERVDVFENLGGETFFLVHRRESPTHKNRQEMMQIDMSGKSDD